MGIEERSLLSRSTCWTCLRSATKCELSFSAASGDNLGAHRLPTPRQPQDSKGREGGDARLAKGDEPLHLVEVDLPDRLLLHGPVHVQRHDVPRDRLSSHGQQERRGRARLTGRTRSRVSSCSSLTMKIMSNRDRIVV